MTTAPSAAQAQPVRAEATARSVAQQRDQLLDAPEVPGGEAPLVRKASTHDDDFERQPTPGRLMHLQTTDAHRRGGPDWYQIGIMSRWA